MKSVRKWIIKSIAVFLIIAALLAASSPILANKGIENENYSAISTFQGFYREPENSLDVLFLGTSNAYCAFSPNELYEKYRLKSYNLASSQQSMLTSYYWLEEALRSQHPKAVVLETFYCFYKTGNEGSLHKAFDWMKLSPVKLRAVNDLCRSIPAGTVSESGKTGNRVTKGTGGNSGMMNAAGAGGILGETGGADAGQDQYHWYDFIFPALRYHDRWSQLEDADLHWQELSEKDQYKGYCPRTEESGRDFITIPDASSSDREVPLNEGAKFAGKAPQTIPDFQKKYLDKISALCREENIRLILVKTPSIEWTPAQHDAVTEYAADAEDTAAVEYTADAEDTVDTEDRISESGGKIDFIDFNVSDFYQKAGYNFAEDNADSMHANVKGAVKLTDYIGAVLTEGE